MSTVYSFNTNEPVNLKQVGGKAMSLIQMTSNGLPVPPGMVCSVEFFKPWFEILKKRPEWNYLMNAHKDDLQDACNKIKSFCMELPYTDKQKRDLTREMDKLISIENTEFFAVRSSSPEEDLDGASFAGAYETVLGVPQSGIEDAIRQSFSSALDARVFLYKEEQGFSRKNPTIAIVVQKQIDSDTAGVAFTLNPLNNAYDEIVINANYGLGESVVSGLVSPDQYIINKLTGELILKKSGKKEIAIHLKENGGTWEEDTSGKSESDCLDREELAQMNAMLHKVEAYYKKPMDTEWAISKNVLYLLQARPITAFIPLPSEMISAPNEPKKLYLDMTLSKQGIQKALSPLGTDWLSWNQRDFMKYLFGRDITGAESGAAVTTEGRSYVTGNMLKMMGPKRQIDAWAQADSIAAEILRSNDLSEYIPKKLPKQLKGAMWGVIKNSMTSIKRARKAMTNPKEYESWFRN